MLSGKNNPYTLSFGKQPFQNIPRLVEINEIKLLSDLDSDFEFTFQATVSKGTYIRSLVRDIGERFGTPATLCALKRTETAGFTLSQCVPLDLLDPRNVNGYILPADTAVTHLKAAEVTEKQAVRFSNGGHLDLDRLNIAAAEDNGLIRVYCKNNFLGLGRIDRAAGRLAVKCLV